jgi:DNA-binding NarL/FixJ family response regulator
VCEPQPIVVEGVKKVLAETNDLFLTAAVSRAAETLDAIQQSQPNVVLLDATSGLTAAFRLLSQLKNDGAVRTVLWVVDLPEIDAFRALQIGARGIIRKTLPVAKLVECLREVAGGKIWMQETEQLAEFLQRKEATRLTPREKEVVRLICRGMRNRQIAENLHITPGTVKVHLMHIFEKTGLKDRLALAVHGADLIGAEAPGQHAEPALKMD